MTVHGCTKQIGAKCSHPQICAVMGCAAEHSQHTGAAPSNENLAKAARAMYAALTFVDPALDVAVAQGGGIETQALSNQVKRALAKARGYDA